MGGSGMIIYEIEQEMQWGFVDEYYFFENEKMTISLKC